MAKLASLSKFFPIQLGILKEGLAVPFALYVYLPLNQRIVEFRHPDDFIDLGFSTHYEAKGILQLFIANQDHGAYLDYIKAVQESKNEEASAAAVNALEKIALDESGAAPQAAKPGDPTPEPAFAKADDTPSPDPVIELTTEQKASIQEGLKTMTTATTPEEVKAATNAMSKAVEESLLEGEDKQSLFTDLWQESAEEDFDGHAKNVATYAVVFAMGMGVKDRTILKSLALAALIHDIGVSQINVNTVRTPAEKRTQEQRAEFENHIRYTLEMLSNMDISFTPALIKLMGQHHEKFDGTGYPKKLKNWDIDQYAQLLSMADIFDQMIRGLFDGESRTLTQAFSTIVVLEKSKIFPQYYNPDHFKQLVTWVESQTDTKILTEADALVQETLTQSMQGNSAA